MTAAEPVSTHQHHPSREPGNATDPVCGMAVEQDKAISLALKGTTDYFCARGCRDEFMQKAT